MPSPEWNCTCSPLMLFVCKRTFRGKSREKTGNSPLYKVGTATHSPAPMILAAIDWLSISINLLLVIFVIICLLMILLILMQRPKQEGLGAAFGGGVTDQVFGARTTNVLQRGTVYLASMFFILSLTLAILIGHRNKVNSLVVKNAPAPVAETPAAPPAPEKSISEEAKDAGQPVPETPAPAPAPAPVTPAPPLETPPPAPTEVPPPAPVVPPAPPAEKPPGQ